MSGPGTTPLFVDTGAFFAHFVDTSPRHERARAVMNAIQAGELRFRPIYTTGYVLSELTTLLLRKLSHETALEALTRVRESPAVTVLHPDEAQFESICDEFERFDDQQISFVDHATGTLASEFAVEHIFAFDSDFRTLGFSLVPDDIDFSAD
ncbi:type II toxin-antitoxin system VapC family toxin [Natronolimnohabitans innermongolicus]|uniref:PilT protein domain protein n=1 Tax=Natronolimnohabitans innermongolicus JCM 12255 TaxID=1227499 RepID=L9WZ51_9EURY|nr:PIN domain-containing protein [Natronolimnohabitans innermongolicus]ELY53623.1 PilT protein domain protein [Natronolimnohabitans innermongolicus JCM 12255]